MCDLLNIGTREPEIDTPEFEGEDDLFRNIYDQEITPEKLPPNLYLFTFFSLASLLKRAFGLPTDFPVNSIRRRRALAAKRNLSFFSGAKTFQNVVELSLAVFDNNGQILPFGDFANIALQINRRYNLNWLRTEQNAAFRQSQAIEVWADIQDNIEDFPLLRYSTVGDSRVRPEHMQLDQVIKPVDDPFWSQWFPPNGFNCRCIVDQLRSGEITEVEYPDNNDPNFGTNVGRNGFIFPASHPYNNVPEQFQEAADGNYGFTIPSDADINKFIDNG